MFMEATRFHLIYDNIVRKPTSIVGQTKHKLLVVS